MNRLSVLLVDDEEELVNTLAERLENRGINARAVTTGNEALAFFRKEKYDIVIADLKMPGIGGLRLKEIMEKEKPGVTVLVVTGHGPQDLGEEQEAASDILMKPFSLDKLMKRIDEVLRSKEEGN